MESELVRETGTIYKSEYDRLMSLGGNVEEHIAQAVTEYLQTGTQGIVSSSSEPPLTLKNVTFSVPRRLARRLFYDKGGLVGNAVALYLRKMENIARMKGQQP